MSGITAIGSNGAQGGLPRGSIAILGAGITGLTVARELSEQFGDRVLLIERESFVGGTAATFRENGVAFDFGSHRLHSSISAEIKNYLEQVVGESLLRRPRNGRLYHKHGFVGYPPTLSSAFSSFYCRRMGCFVKSFVDDLMIPSDGELRTFEAVMQKRVGRRLYEEFFVGYARKLWGKDASELSADALKQRAVLLNAESLRRMLLTKSHSFLYPAQGIGQIAESLQSKILRAGGRIACQSTIRRIAADRSRVNAIIIEGPLGLQSTVDVELLISTIAPDELLGAINPDGSVCDRLEWRGLRVLSVQLERAVSQRNDTYYFPTLDTAFGRVSETHQFSPWLNRHLAGIQLTIEIPDAPGGRYWEMPGQELAELCVQDLIKAGVVSRGAGVSGFWSRKMEKAYPIYALGWRTALRQLSAPLLPLKNLFSIGKRARFLQCNIDHCMIQALELANLIKQNRWHDQELWNKVSQPFAAMQARD